MTSEPKSYITAVAWSPCSRFIAVAQASSYHKTIGILDSVTLEQLNTFQSSHRTEWVSFSPDGDLLVGFDHRQGFTSWDLQTGGPVGTFIQVDQQKFLPMKSSFDSLKPPVDTTPLRPYVDHCFSSTFSTDGKMAAAAYKDNHSNSAIFTYDLYFGTQICSHYVSEGQIIAPIWTHDECVQFAIVKAGSITIWEVGFASIHTLAEVVSLSAPHDISYSGNFLFLPPCFLLAYTHNNVVLVWDAQNSQLLLNVGDANHTTMGSFSPDGCFFAYGTAAEIHLWKESPNGYVPHKKLIFNIQNRITPLISPNGESAIMFSNSTIQLWYTTGPASSPSSIPTQHPQQLEFILEFSPDGMLAAVAQLGGNVATVLNLKSGDPQLIIDTGMKILGLGLAESTIGVVGEGTVVIWNFSAGDCMSNARVNIDDSIQTTMFNHPRQNSLPLAPYISMSPNLNYIAIAWCSVGAFKNLNIYDVYTGKCVVHAATDGVMPWFTLDGCEVWCIESGSLKGWTVIKDSESGLTKLEPIGPAAHSSGGFPWQSPLGYKVTHQWVLSSSGKRLLWLPHLWRIDQRDMKWCGQFLGLLHSKLPNAVILELSK